MSHESLYRIAFRDEDLDVVGYSVVMSRAGLFSRLREMRQDYGSLETMQRVLRLPDPVERVR